MSKSGVSKHFEDLFLNKVKHLKQRQSKKRKINSSRALVKKSLGFFLLVHQPHFYVENAIQCFFKISNINIIKKQAEILKVYINRFRHKNLQLNL